MAYRADNRLLDAPMVSVACRRCGVEVLARKSTWSQTSVQWTAHATEHCRQRQDAAAEQFQGTRMFLECSDLRASIAADACQGRLPVLDPGRP
jgi:hypothetical protein